MTLADTNNHTEHQPSKDALKDDWLDAWLCPTGEPLRSLCAAISEAVRAHDKEAIKAHNEAVRAWNATRPPGAKAEPERRARKDDDNAQLDKAIGLVTCNLARVGLVDGTRREVAYSRRKAIKATRYDNGLVQTETFRTAIERMETLGLLEDTRGVYQARSSTLRPTEGFLSELAAHEVKLEDLGRNPEEETIILKSRTIGFEADGTPIFRDGGKRLPYEDTDRSRALRAELVPLNDFLASADIAFLDDSDKPRVDTTQRKLRRFFAVVEKGPHRFDKGGRLFGGWWQNLKKHRRAHIRVEGEECSYLDYASIFPRLAYAKVGQPVPEGDLYDLRGHLAGFDHSLHRKGTKVAFNSLFFGREKLDAETKGDLPKGVTLPRFQQAVALKHPALQPLLGSLVGFDLMMAESSIILGVCDELRRIGVVGLPVHDAILVKRSTEAQALLVMAKVAQDIAGVDVPALSSTS